VIRTGQASIVLLLCGPHVNRLRPNRKVLDHGATAFVLAVFSLPWQVAFSEPVLISNAHLGLAFEARNGQWLEFVDLDAKLNFITPAQDRPALWQISLSSGGKSNQPLTLARATSCRVNKTGPDSVELVWEKFGLSEAPDLRVVAQARLVEDQAASQWHLAVENLGPCRVGEARFPQLPGLIRQDNERLAVPTWMGQVAIDPRGLLRGNRNQGRQLEFDYPGDTSMQCLAWYQENGPGFYLSCDDTNAFWKSFVFAGTGEGEVDCWPLHLPEGKPAPAPVYKLPYRVVIGTFRGDWFTAAEIYRAWATNQVWVGASRLRRNTVPRWVPSTALWIWNRGRSTNVIQPALVLGKELSLPVSIFWHWWHGCSYDTEFPEYLPPREGADTFTAALAAAQAQGIHALVYMNQRLWCMTTKSWAAEGAEQFAVKGKDGRVHSEVYNTFTKAPCASMCPDTTFWRNKYASLAETALRQLGVDGIYMDQACSSLACFDPAHGHPLGGGTYWMNGFRLLAADIRQRGGGRAVTLAGEGVGESWLPHLDLMLSLQVSRERYAAPDGWEPIPFFQAVYHPFAIQFGNYSSLTMPPYDELWPAEFAPWEELQLLERKFSRQFYLEQARAFVWGQQPTLANFRPSHLQDRPEEIAYVLQLARLRHRTKKFLLDGTFLRPPLLHAPEDMLDFSRLSIYAGQGGGLTNFQKRVPLALAGAWRAADGSLGLALASVANLPQDLDIELPPTLYPRPEPARLWRTDENGRREVGHFQPGDALLSVLLPPRGACVLEISRE
jgi:hypothetical protein